MPNKSVNILDVYSNNKSHRGDFLLCAPVEALGVRQVGQYLTYSF